MPTTILVQEKTIFWDSLGRGLSLEPENRTTWATSRKANNTWKNKTKTQAKQKKTTFGRMFGFDLCFWVSLVFFCLICWFWNGKTKKKHCFLFFWMDMINQDLKQSNKPKLFLFFQHFRFGFLHWNVSKTKHSLNSFVFFLFLLEFFVCFCFFSIDSHDCHLCPYACLPYRSWEVKFWSKLLSQELAHCVRLSLA